MLTLAQSGKGQRQFNSEAFNSNRQGGEAQRLVDDDGQTDDDDLVRYTTGTTTGQKSGGGSCRGTSVSYFSMGMGWQKSRRTTIAKRSLTDGERRE